jgi:hypothetical protein
MTPVATPGVRRAVGEPAPGEDIYLGFRRTSRGFSGTQTDCVPADGSMRRRPRPVHARGAFASGVVASSSRGWPRSAGPSPGSGVPGRAGPVARTRSLPEYPNRSHTAHVPSSAARICYRYHPLFGREVQIVRRCGNASSEGILISLPDGIRRALPEWMLNPVTCSLLTDDVKPRIACSALWALRQLIDAQPLASAHPSVSSDAIPDTGGDHVRTPSAATPAALPHPS